MFLLVSDSVCMSNDSALLQNSQIEAECTNESMNSQYIFSLCFLYSSVNGNYTAWQNDGGCSTTCGAGLQRQVRFCTNPAPAFGGNDCSSLGANAQFIGCNLRQCPGKNVSLYQLVSSVQYTTTSSKREGGREGEFGVYQLFIKYWKNDFNCL